MFNRNISEPPDVADDKPISCLNPIIAIDSPDNTNLRHPSTVPASGRGNSDDGKKWINPSANQLFNACKKKNKHMEEKDKNSVALIHGEVIEKTWNAVMEYENLHKHQCNCPTLSSFEGLYGKPSFKAKFLNKFGYPLPWDRHDWYIDRCGTKIRYIIDYHQGLHQDQPYIIDCRPDLKRFSNIMDRFIIQYRRIKANYYTKKTNSGFKEEFLTDMFEEIDQKHDKN